MSVRYQTLGTSEVLADRLPTRHISRLLLSQAATELISSKTCVGLCRQISITSERRLDLAANSR
jgi:hypothetical protein